MDIHTLAAVLGLVTLAQAAVLVLLYRSHATMPGLGYWAAGNCAFAVGFVCNHLRDMALFGSVMVIANNFFFISGLILLYYGIERFFGQPAHRTAVSAVFFLFMLTVVYFTLVAPDLQVRRILFALAVAGFSLLIVSALRTFRSYRYRAVDLLLAAYALNGLFFAWRAAQLIAEASTSGMFAASILEVTTYLVVVLVSILSTPGFIMLVSQRALAESSEAREHFELIFNASPNAVLITSLDEGRLVSINDAFTDLTGYTREELVGRTTLDLAIWQDNQVRSRIVEQLITTGNCKNIELVFNHKDGHQIDGLFSATIISLHGSPHILSVTQDISERKQAEAAMAELNTKLEAMSSTDSLTGLANRRHFDDMFAREYARHVRSGSELALIMVDIDCFKPFNDTYGHLAGDACLREISQVLLNSTNRAADLVARYGGEEFVCILPETDAAGAVVIAERIRQGIYARAIPHKSSTVCAYVTASLGVITARCTAERQEHELLEQADALLYQAKEQGRNRLVWATMDGGAASVPSKEAVSLVSLIWKPSFCCGNQVIDTQHRTLVAMTNNLLNRLLMQASKHESGPAIAALLEEVARHFHDEEQCLARIGYAGLPEHAAEHGALLAKGHELARLFEEDGLAIGDLFEFLAHEVVMRHMLESDRAFFPYLQEARPEAAAYAP